MRQSAASKRHTATDPYTMHLKRLETLITEPVGEHVLVVTLNRPKAANAFNSQMARELFELFEQFTLNPAEVRCIVVTGAGDRAFCAGGDLKERNEMNDAQWTKQHQIYERMTRAIINCPVPMIGAINGAAYGGGCEIACMLDFLYAADTARFALPETSLGIIPGAGGTQTLPRAVGERRAKEIILTTEPFSAKQALDWGLVNAIFPADQLLPQAVSTANKIGSNAPVAIRQAKQSIQKGLQMSLADGLAFEIEAYNRTVPTRDRREGVLAFNEKRKPDFKGC